MFVNMKITFDLNSELIADRFLSIDSILLNAHYSLLRKKGDMATGVFVEAEDDLESLSQWIEVKHGALSGSIWYLERDAFLMLHNAPIRKTTNPQAIFDATGKKITSDSKRTPQSGEFKRFDLAFETMQVDSVYFYVRGDRDYIEKLCKEVKYIGKKASAGYGWIKGFAIETIEADKSFMVDEFTPSRPLSFKNYDIDSKKVAYYRTLPPYYDKKNQELCYMPTSSLVERSDNSKKNSAFKVADISGYLANTEFLYNRLHTNTSFDFKKHDVHKSLRKIGDNVMGESLFADGAEKGTCACCGKEFNVGVLGEIKNLFSASFNDFPMMGKEKGVCLECLWSVQENSCKQIDFSLVDQNEVDYLYGKNMSIEGAKEQSQYRREFIENLDLLSVPYSVNFNTNSGKSNHIGFKGKVTVSNALAVFNYGDTGGEFVDVELLKEGLAEMIDLMEKTKSSKKKDSGLKKTHFLNLEDYKGNFDIANELNTLENRVLLSEFHKKYNAPIRRALHKVVL
ncbi:MAG: hypothetical protein QG567_946 [Campylobacterota bacterium]|nr:hypothetical protein [Campylobacterota bacterium]